MARVITVNDVLDGHVVLDLECLDRIYLNAYVPILQTSSQVVAFLSGHLGFPFPSPALFRQMGDRFRKAVLSFSDANDIPWIRFEKDEAKLEVMAPHLARQAGTGRSGVAAIGVAQEFQRVWTASEGKTSTGTPRWSFFKADRRVTCYYFYLWDRDFGPYADRPVMPHRVPLCWSQRLPGVQCGISSRGRVRVTGRRGRPGGCRAACIVLQGRFGVPAVRAPVP
jgi:hypothetical protein